MGDDWSDALIEAAGGMDPPPVEEEDRLAVSLQKALDNTTPERSGTPWDGSDEDPISEELFERGVAQAVELPDLLMHNKGHYSDES